ncbi:MAG: hypothetical protein R2778_07885 [Saprospiraceae bacterium]
MYANTTGEQLTFKLYDSSDGLVYSLNEQLGFASNQHFGAIQDPVPFTLGL